MQQQVRLVPMWALSLAVNLVVQVLSVAVHKHYKRIYNESSNKWWDLSNWIRLFNYQLCGFSLLFLRHEILVSWILCVSFYNQFGDLTLDLTAVTDAGLFNEPALAGSPCLHQVLFYALESSIQLLHGGSGWSAWFTSAETWLVGVTGDWEDSGHWDGCGDWL